MSDESSEPKPPAGEQSLEEQLQVVRLVPLRPLTGKIVIAPYNDEWPRMFAAQGDRIRAALGERSLLLEHVGSTSVPGLAAKPIIDIALVVADPANEADYIPALEAAGYTLHIREPGWYQHRLLKYTNPDVHLHVFGPDCEEVERLLMMRDWLRRNEADRALYERTKRELAQRDWTYTQQYADAKTAIVQEILARAQAVMSAE
jgi:GrpB-like predicted nucleotidyltransferase (UPF0157 family)